MTTIGKDKKKSGDHHHATARRHYRAKVRKEHEWHAKKTLAKHIECEQHKRGIAKGGSGESKQASPKSDELSHMEKWKS